MTAEAVVSQLVIFLGSHILLGDILTLCTGEQETTAVELQVAVHRKQHAPGVRACQDAAACIGINVDDIIQKGVVRFTGQTEILQKTQPEALLCLRIKADENPFFLGHHHPQIFL